jgi:hypothetical protein
LIKDNSVLFGISAGVIGGIVDYLIEGQPYSAIKAVFIFGVGTYVLGRILNRKSE